MGKLDEIEIHEGCGDIRCRRCMEASDALEEALTSALGNRHDWLGVYHYWIVEEGVSPETPGGWWSREALSDDNVSRFIDERKGME